MQSAKTVLRALAAATLILASASLGACASGARADKMIVSSAVAATQPGEPGYKQFRVAGVQGGSETNPLLASNVADTEFQSALVASLKATNYLADDTAQASGEITASLTDLKQPMVGLNMSVTSQVRYSATRTDGGGVIYDDTVAATGTATVGEAFAGVERLRLANEKSIQANIEAFIQRFRDALKAQ